MSDPEEPGDELGADQLAFEYVLGTMRDDERRAFEVRMHGDDQVASAVRQWEEHLMSLQPAEQSLPPKPQTWDAIERSIATPASEPRARSWFLPWVWAASGAMAAMLLFVGLPVLQEGAGAGEETLVQTARNVDYVAVLTGAEGDSALTALGEATSQTLRLQWDAAERQGEESLQLWAVSRRDGETRSLAVFDEEIDEIVLDDAHWRLIVDAHSLVLTREESGGSPIDEPSSDVIGRGICVRLRQQESAS